MTVRYNSDNPRTARGPGRQAPRGQTPRAALAGVLAAAALFLLPAASRGGPVNGDFAAGLSGWQVDGPVTDGGGYAVLAEDPTKILTTLSRELAVPVGAESLTFDFRLAAQPDGTSGWPFPDALAVSLLDPVTFAPLRNTPGYTEFFYTDADGATEYDPALVDIAGDTVTLDLSALAPTDVLLAFDLLGGDNGKAVTVDVDNVVLTQRQDALIPEPTCVAMLATALAGLVGYTRRRRRA